MRPNCTNQGRQGSVYASVFLILHDSSKRSQSVVHRVGGLPSAAAASVSSPGADVGLRDGRTAFHGLSRARLGRRRHGHEPAGRGGAFRPRGVIGHSLERGSARDRRVHAESAGRGHAVEQDSPDVLSRRRAWFDAQPDLDPERLAFVDGEVDRKSIRWIDFPTNGTAANMARSHGRCPRGARLLMDLPDGHRGPPRWSRGCG